MIVCDSGPLIALGGVEQLHLLQGLFGRVCAPREVVDECLAGGSGGTGREAVRKAAWLDVVDLGGSPDPLLTSLLDLGESRAIELALNLGADALLMDEARGRRVARNIYSLSVVGTGRVLVEAKRAGLLPAVAPVVDAIRANGYWLADRIVAEILRQAGE